MSKQILLFDFALGRQPPHRRPPNDLSKNRTPFSPALLLVFLVHSRSQGNARRRLICGPTPIMSTLHRANVAPNFLRLSGSHPASSRGVWEIRVMTHIILFWLPENVRHRPSAGSMLGQRLWRCPNIEQHRNNASCCWNGQQLLTFQVHPQ